jgi:hypothetical protein
MSVEQSVEWELAREPEVLLGENLSHSRFVYHKSHITWPGSNSGRCGGKAATSRLSYGTAIQWSRNASEDISASFFKVELWWLQVPSKPW